MREFFREIPVLSAGDITLRALMPEDAGGLETLQASPKVYRLLPTFLYERGRSAEYVIRHVYGECFPESLILAVTREGTFCGLAEFYAYRAPLRKMSVGYRLLPAVWGRGIATKALGLMVAELQRKGIEIIAASTLPGNTASERVLEKNGFLLAAADSPEDWGYEKPLPTNKWFL